MGMRSWHAVLPGGTAGVLSVLPDMSSWRLYGFGFTVQKGSLGFPSSYIVCPHEI